MNVGRHLSMLSSCAYGVWNLGRVEAGRGRDRSFFPVVYLYGVVENTWWDVEKEDFCIDTGLAELSK
jgi:hypothetical protein